MYATHEFGAKKNTENSFVPIRDESDEKRAVLVGKKLLLLCCVVGR